MAAGRDPARPMGGRWYSRRLIQLAEDATERRKVPAARRLYQQHRVYSMLVRDATARATVQGSQLDPFGIRLARVPADATDVLALLAGSAAVDEVAAVPRGTLGKALGGLVLPESMSDITVDCSCPDHSGACTHALALIYELCAAADADPGVILDFAGVSLATLLARLTADPRRSAARPGAAVDPGDVDPEAVDPGAVAAGAVDPAVFYGEMIALPPLPAPPPVDPLTDLDSALLRTALRRTGTGAADVVEAVDELSELYGRLRRDGGGPAH